MTFDQRVLLCLGAGISQLPVIKAAKDLGHFIIAVDQDLNSPGFEYADTQINCSTHNAQGIIDKLIQLSDFRELNMHIDGILNRSSGPPVLTAAKIAEHYSIPCLPVKVAETVINKNYLKEECQRLGFKQSNFMILNTNDSTQLDIVDYPVVVKPALSLIGKSGITIVNSRTLLDEAIDDAIECSLNGSIIVEQFITGTDFSLISFVEKCQIIDVCILEEINEFDANGKIYGRGFKTCTMPHHFLLKNKLIAIAQRFVSAMQIERSPFMASFRMDQDNNIHLMEIHLDIGGDVLIESLFPAALNFDYTKLTVQMSLGVDTLPTTIDVVPAALLFDRTRCRNVVRNTNLFTADNDAELNRTLRKEMSGASEKITDRIRI